MSELTPAELAELRRLSEAAMPGPWIARVRGGVLMPIVGYCDPASPRNPRGDYGGFLVGNSGFSPKADEAARFIAAARNAIPRLLDLVEQLRAELAKTERADELEWMGQAKDGRDLYAVKATRQEGSGKNG